MCRIAPWPPMRELPQSVARMDSLREACLAYVERGVFPETVCALLIAEFDAPRGRSSKVRSGGSRLERCSPRCRRRGAGHAIAITVGEYLPLRLGVQRSERLSGAVIAEVLHHLSQG